MTDDAPAKSRNFIQEIIDADNRSGKWGGRVCTRFPPEPNGYPHIGHAQAILLNYNLAVEYGGEFHLRFDDTNPIKEEEEFVHAIIRDVRWLGARWVGYRDDDPLAGVLFASDYFEQFYQYALQLIRKGLAYVDDLSPEEIREYRGTLTKPGRESPFRARDVEENLDLFERMRSGEFPDGSRTLRAKIDMQHANLNMRDPVMYRILHARHHRTGDDWCIYPMYDWAHGLEDSIEGITHSICTLEFENHRPLYDWFLDQLTDDQGRPIHHPQQIEFARLNVSHTVMSKRSLRLLVEQGHVRGWDDPRMPTLCGLRRRGYPPEAVQDFCRRVGVAKYQGVRELALLEHCVRDQLNKTAPRVMAVLNPLKVVITNWADGGDPDRVEQLEAINNPEDPAAGTRTVPFARELYIERDDFMEDPPRKFFRLAPGREVRLRYGYFITCREVVKDDAGEIVELRCTYDPATRGGDAPDGRKVKATLHWVAAPTAVQAEVRLYETLFNKADPEEVEPEAAAKGADFRSNLNPDSLRVLNGCMLEPSLASATPGQRFQFERLGYFCVDADSRPERLVFNRTATLRDTWAKIRSRGSP